MADEGDLRAAAELYNLTRQTERQHSAAAWRLAWATAAATPLYGRTERKVSENFMLLHSVIWLRQDDCTEYVPLVGKLEQMFNSVSG